jgi:glycosyltransferase involved in cell wall biosynthesis
MARHAVILIATYNRARLLAATLDSLAQQRVRQSLTWEVLVVDNNSDDGTCRVVADRRAHSPVPIRYLFEPRQGKSWALNTGIGATDAPIIAFTDDDVIVPEGWLEAGVLPLLERRDVDYTGGPVRPLWERPKPHWLDERGNLGGTIAVKDHGDEPFVFEDRARTPLGVNMAVRRALIDRIGRFRPDLGRRGESLLGQEQAEFFCRSRAAGARGLYVPAMMLYHRVPGARLTRRYFRRWWFWKGVSHARLHDIHRVTELGVDLDRTPHVAGVPRFLYGEAFWDIAAWMGALVRSDAVGLATHEMQLAYVAGYVWVRSRLGACRRQPASDVREGFSHRDAPPAEQPRDSTAVCS